jgi:hypothetical protein
MNARILWICLAWLSFWTIPQQAWSQSLQQQVTNQVVPHSDYAIYLIWGSAPALYAGMHMQIHEVPSILWVQRSAHFDFDYLPNHVKLVRDELLQQGTLEQEISRLIKQNPRATYTVYVTDTMAGWAIVNFFLTKGLKLEQLTIEFLSDGSGTTNLYHQTYYGKANAEALFAEHRALTQRRIRNSIANPENIRMWEYYQMYAFSKEFGDVRMWLSHSASVFGDSPVAASLNFFELPFRTMYTSLRFLQRRNFERLMRFDRKEFDRVLLSDRDKIPLVVIGGWSSDAEGNRSVSPTFSRDINALVQHFGSGYRYFFKGHPELPNGNRAEAALMKSLGFENLPNTAFPFELLLFAYPDLVVGGYQSSVFSSASPHQLRFLLGDITAQPMLALYQQNTWPNLVRIGSS